MPTSFRPDRTARPARYRTPSPPRIAFEPLSPTFTPLDIGNPHAKRQQYPVRFEPGASNTNGVNDKYGARSSNDSMGVFADIALSTQAYPSTTAAKGSTKRPLSGSLYAGAPPSKRARSENLPSSPQHITKQGNVDKRPVTSYEQVRAMDAELLLGFYQSVRDAAQLEEPGRLTGSAHEKLAGRSPRRKKSSPQSFYAQLQQASREPEMPSPQESSAKSKGVGMPPRKTGQETGAKRVTKSSSAQIIEAESEMASARSGARRVTKSPSAQIIEAESETASVNLPPSRHSEQKSSLVLAGDERNPSDAKEKGHENCPQNAPTIQDSEAPTQIKSIAKQTSEGPDTATASMPNLEKALEGTSVEETTTLAPTESKAKNAAGSAVCSACKFARNSAPMDGNHNATSWISCDGCKLWFHFACAGFKNEREVRAVDKYRCKKCKPIYGATSYVRKSARAHNAIDYAGLHQGVFKTSDDKTEHHYIQPIKDGIITFLPENFARLHPSLVTADFFEKSGGMKEPVVIPAALNPRPPSLLQKDEAIQQGASEDAISRDIEMALDEAEYGYAPDHGQDGLDMVIPQGLTVRQVAELYGPEEKIEVIDVKSQNGENRKWNMRKWVDYYENQNSNKVVRNVISLEVSQSKLGRLIRRPKVVRDLDLQDSVWPEELLAKGEFPRVQFYCLMSVADCFTDFHIDFGGSSVFYHIIRGKKTFLFIPPKEKHLKKYEEWCMSPAQNWTFLADQTKECYRVDLSEGDTMLIPSGWIHAVWTPEDSLVIGGNFLTRMSFGMQLRIAQVEKATGVARKFRYPYFQKLYWFTALQYLEEDPIPEAVKTLLHSGETFKRDLPTYLDFNAWGENSHSGHEQYHAKYYSQSELDGLAELAKYILRTALIDAGHITDVTAETRNAVKKSIPRGRGDPVDIVKDFAAWTAWKRGNESIPHWAYPDAAPETMMPDKLSGVASKKLDREAAREAARQAPRRQSARNAIESQKAAELLKPDIEQGIHEHQSLQFQVTPLKLDLEAAQETSIQPEDQMSPTGSSASNRKPACEACRRRRRACKHRDVITNETPSEDSGQPSTDIQPIIPIGLGALNTQPTNNLFSSLIGDPNIPGHNIFSTLFERPKSELDSFALNNEHMMAPIERSLEVSSTSSNAATSRARAKACNDCRKSKRRCIHDADGKEDPVKVAEQAVPRPHARKNRKSNGSATMVSPVQLQSGPASDQLVSAAPVAHMIPAFDGPSDEPIQDADVKQEQQVLSDGAPRVSDEHVSQEPNAEHHHVSEPAHAPMTEAGMDKKADQAESSRVDEVVPEDSAAEPSAETHAATAQEPAPDTFLISPPASSHDDSGNSPASQNGAPTPSPPQSRRSSDQGPGRTSSSSDHKDRTTSPSSRDNPPIPASEKRITPDSNTFRRTTSSSSLEKFEDKEDDAAVAKSEAAKSKKGKKTPKVKAPVPPPSGSPSLPQEGETVPISSPTALAPTDADEESLRLIKELQAQDRQDRGLRRRGAGMA